MTSEHVEIVMATSVGHEEVLQLTLFDCFKNVIRVLTGF